MTDVATNNTVEINDAVFCLTHFKEVVRFHTFLLPSSTFPSHPDHFFVYQCTDCDVDLREENDGFFGVRIIS